MTANSDELGQVRQIFRPKPVNISAGVILGLALIFGGIAAGLFIAQRDASRPMSMTDKIANYAIIGSVGFGAPVGGVVLLVWMTRLAFLRVTIFDNGFSHEYRGSTEIVPWAGVEKITEVLTKEQLRILYLPGASIKNTDRSFLIRRKDGKEFWFTVNSINSISQLAKYLEEASSKHAIHWECIEQ